MWGRPETGKPSLDRERRQADLRARRDHLETLAKLPKLDKAGLTHELRQRLTDWRSLLDAEPVKARQIVRKLVPEQIVFEPDPTRRLYTFRGRRRMAACWQGRFYKMRCAPGVTRTPGTQFRKLLLYPPELRGRKHSRDTRVILPRFIPSKCPTGTA